MTREPIWLQVPESHDYLAAKSYLQLLMPPAAAEAVVFDLEGSTVATFKAKDVLRASRLDTLDSTNPHVAKDLHKISNEHALSPILLVRGDARSGHPLIIADGYHRVCAVLLVDENAEVPCKIADLS